jgi:hypothetical protein
MIRLCLEERRVLTPDQLKKSPVMRPGFGSHAKTGNNGHVIGVPDDYNTCLGGTAYENASP